jgi:hypothetical protein
MGNFFLPTNDPMRWEKTLRSWSNTSFAQNPKNTPLITSSDPAERKCAEWLVFAGDYWEREYPNEVRQPWDKHLKQCRTLFTDPDVQLRPRLDSDNEAERQCARFMTAGEAYWADVEAAEKKAEAPKGLAHGFGHWVDPASKN